MTSPDSSNAPLSAKAAHDPAVIRPAEACPNGPLVLHSRSECKILPVWLLNDVVGSALSPAQGRGPLPYPSTEAAEDCVLGSTLHRMRRFSLPLMTEPRFGQKE
jgi:hypothetical protein